jgi:hypothetical protein
VQAALPDGTYSFLALLQANEIRISARGGHPVNHGAIETKVAMPALRTRMKKGHDSP